MQFGVAILIEPVWHGLTGSGHQGHSKGFAKTLSRFSEESYKLYTSDGESHIDKLQDNNSRFVFRLLDALLPVQVFLRIYTFVKDRPPTIRTRIPGIDRSAVQLVG